MPSDWTVSVSNEEKFYKLFETESQFSEAMLHCIAMGGRLATFKDNKEAKQLKKLGEDSKQITLARLWPNCPLVMT